MNLVLIVVFGAGMIKSKRRRSLKKKKNIDIELGEKCSNNKNVKIEKSVD